MGSVGGESKRFLGGHFISWRIFDEVFVVIGRVISVVDSRILK
jgi:hypothetical protein